MFFKHVYDTSLAQGSYIIGCQVTGESIVIDPKRDIDTYLEIAKENDLRITHVAETHIHADFLCGSRELAAVTGAKIYLSDEGGEDWQYEFPHEGLKEGDTITIGNLSLRVLHTPGHTPESISFILVDHPATDEPVMLFSGDFVFVGDIGRPDLLEEAAGLKNTKRQSAQEMFRSLKKFSKIPGYVQVWPAHGAGSACGKALGSVPSSTVGYEKIRNWALQHENSETEFVDELLSGQPEPPKYFAMMKHLNKVERKLLTEVPKQPKLSKDDFMAAYQKGLKVIDTRANDVFAKGYLPNTINIQNGNSFATWAGWFIEYDEDFILIASDEDVEDVTRKLMRIGLDNVYGYISDISDLGVTLQTKTIVSMGTLQSAVHDDTVQIVDVRGQSEYKEGHVETAKNVFLGTIEENLDKLEKNKKIILYCQTGNRSSIAASLLAKNGFADVNDYSGGMQEWMAHKNKLVSGEEEVACC